MDFTEMGPNIENKVMPVIKGFFRSAMWPGTFWIPGDCSVNESWDHLRRQEYFIKCVV